MLNRTKLDLRSALVKTDAERLRSDVMAASPRLNGAVADDALLMLALDRCDILEQGIQRLREALRAELESRILG